MPLARLPTIFSAFHFNGSLSNLQVSRAKHKSPQKASSGAAATKPAETTAKTSPAKAAAAKSPAKAADEKSPAKPSPAKSSEDDEEAAKKKRKFNYMQYMSKRDTMAPPHLNEKPVPKGSLVPP